MSQLILNPATGRMVKVDGRIGRALLKKAPLPQPQATMPKPWMLFKQFLQRVAAEDTMDWYVNFLTEDDDVHEHHIQLSRIHVNNTEGIRYIFRIVDKRCVSSAFVASSMDELLTLIEESAKPILHKKTKETLYPSAQEMCLRMLQESTFWSSRGWISMLYDMIQK